MAGNHNGDHAGVYLHVEIQESEVEHLKVQLLHAQEELEYLKRHQNVEIHEALEQALRCNQLLEATIGDLRDELKSAKDALLSHGRIGMIRSITPYTMSPCHQFIPPDKIWPCIEFRQARRGKIGSRKRAAS